MLLKEIIVEGLNTYKPMFTPYFEGGVIPPNVITKMNQIETVMQRRDRITWMMRWYRCWLFSFDDLPVDATPEQAKSYQLKMKKLAKDVGASSIGEAREVSDLAVEMLDNFTHWFSLPIEQIKKYVFDRQEPADIMREFNIMEQEWIDTRNRMVKVEDSHEMIIDFGNGWAWFNLNKSNCSTEGEAMGHCGNGASYKYEDTLLSLRSHVYDEFWAPHLTFILHGNGFLGEMKGRGNDKPAQKYHTMIYALLNHDLVQGISGGGYLPEHNFKIDDLPRAEAAALKAAKWGFCNYWELNRDGREKEANLLISGYVEDRGVKINEVTGEIIIRSFDSIHTFISREVWGWSDLFSRIDQEVDDNIWYMFKNDYYIESLKEHIYDFKSYVHECFVHFGDNGAVQIGMSIDDFASAVLGDDDDDQFGETNDLDAEYDGHSRDIGDVSSFIDDIDEAIVTAYLDDTTSNLSRLVMLIEDRYNGETSTKYSFGSPTVRDENQQEFDLGSK